MSKFTDLNYLKSFLKSSGLKPKHYMGQNFLVDEEALQAIVNSADLKKSDMVLEVGPGIGVLTQELVARAGQVIAVEKDERMVGILGRVFNVKRWDPPPWNKGELEGVRSISARDLTPPTPSYSKRGFPNASSLQLINQDILKFHLDKYIPGPYKVVANIPYYLTSKLFQYFLNQKNKPELLVLMVQKEVGERVVAPPGKLSILGISVHLFADVEIVSKDGRTPSVGDLTEGVRASARLSKASSVAEAVYPKGPIASSRNNSARPPLLANAPLPSLVRPNPLIIPKTSFWPAPEVDSVILKITPKNKYPEITDQKLFFQIIKTAFAGKRKQIHNTLKDYSHAINKAGIDPKARPQELSIEQWINIYQGTLDKP